MDRELSSSSPSPPSSLSSSSSSTPLTGVSRKQSFKQQQSSGLEVSKPATIAEATISIISKKTLQNQLDKLASISNNRNNTDNVEDVVICSGGGGGIGIGSGHENGTKFTIRAEQPITIATFKPYGDCLTEKPPIDEQSKQQYLVGQAIYTGVIGSGGAVPNGNGNDSALKADLKQLLQKLIQ